MKLVVQKRLAASILGCSRKRIRFDPSMLEQIKEAVTKADIKSLIKGGVVKKRPIQGISRGRYRKRIIQKRKGRQKGQGHRKGKKTARSPRKREWINKIRLQRNVLKSLKQSKSIDNTTFRMMYRKSKGGFFRSKRHMLVYLEENRLIKERKE